MTDLRSSWYHLLDAGDLTLRQGDILLGFEYQCPTPYVWPPLTADENSDPPVAVELEQSVAVLTACCDLDPNNKKKRPGFVLLCPIWDFEEVAKCPDISGVSEGHKEQIEKGSMPRYCLLAPSDLVRPHMKMQVADFSRAFPLPKKVVDEFVGEASPRLRMNPPYREWFARAFANCYTRIGLPVQPSHALVTPPHP